MIRWQYLKNDPKLILYGIGILIIIIVLTAIFLSYNWANDEATSSINVIKSQKSSTASLSNNAISIKGSLIKILKPNTNYSIICLASLPNGVLAIGSDIGRIFIWNTTETSDKNHLRTLNGHINWVRCLKKLSDDTLASGSDDRTIKIWNTQNEKLLRTLVGHTNWVYSLEELKTGLLASGSEDKTIKLWKPSTGQLVQTIEASLEVYQMVLVNGGNHLAITSYLQNTLLIIDTQAGLTQRRLEYNREYNSIIKLCVLSDGTLGSESLVVSESSRLMILNVMNISSDAQLLRVIAIKDDIIYALQALSTTTRDASDGYLASGLGSGEIEIWDVRNGQLVNSFRAHASPVTLMASLSDGSLATTSGDENSVIKIWK